MIGIAAALIPLLAQIIPGIAGWFGGDRAEETAGQVVNVVRAVTGGATDPATVAAVLADPTKGAEIAVQLARIQADREKARDEAITARMRAAVEDTANARATMTTLAAQKSPLAYGSAMVSAVILALFSLMVVAEQFGYPAIGEGSKQLVQTALTLVLGYWVGSSSGSAAKDTRIAATNASALTTAATAAAVLAETAGPPVTRSLFGRRDS